MSYASLGSLDVTLGGQPCKWSHECPEPEEMCSDKGICTGVDCTEDGGCDEDLGFKCIYGWCQCPPGVDQISSDPGNPYAKTRCDMKVPLDERKETVTKAIVGVAALAGLILLVESLRKGKG